MAKGKIIILSSVFLLAAVPFFSNALFVGESRVFYVDKEFDVQGREQVDFLLKRVGNKAYYFVDKNWYENLPFQQKVTVDSNLVKLANEFDLSIYPKATKLFGSEWSPGIDEDPKVFIVFQQLKSNNGGYFLNVNEYDASQFPISNEKEMIYLSSDILLNSNLNIIYSFVSHEFLHLITFNQKDRLQNKTEEVWLNEMISETAPSILGYNAPFKGSMLENRMKQFKNYPFDSLVEWQNSKVDYAIVSIFGEYLLEHYSSSVFIDVLKSDSIGIPSLNRVLLSASGDSFFDVFINWITASIIQDCDLHFRFCYKSEDFQNMKVTPRFIFLPSTNDTNISLEYAVKPFSFSAYKIVGEDGNLSIQFTPQQDKFRVRFLSCSASKCSTYKDFEVEEGKSAIFSVENFSKDSYIIIIPVLESKIVGFNDLEPPSSFTINISIEKNNNLPDKEDRKRALLAKIAELKSQLRELERELQNLEKESFTCNSIDLDLYFGMNNQYVKCLQEFLSSQGSDIYPEKLTTGYFGPLTFRAVKRFQEKYKSEILEPIGLYSATGYVGPMTRKKINELISAN